MITIGKYNSIRKIVQLNTVLFVSVFVIIMGFSGIYLYELRKENVYSNLTRAATDAKSQLDIEFEFLQQNLRNLRDSVAILELDHGQQGLQFYNRSLMSIVQSRKVQFNAYLALDRSWSEKFFHQKGFISAFHRDPALFSKPAYLSQESLIQETFTDPNYQGDVSESWYHITKRSRHIEYTDIYFDSTYMKQWMVTAGLGVYDSNGVFQGMVGIDILLDELARQLEDVELGKTGGILLVDLRTNRILTRLQGQPGEFVHVNERYDQPTMSEARFKKWQHLLSSQHRHEILPGDQGNRYVVSTIQLDKIPWAVVSFQKYSEAFAPLFWQIALMTLTGAIGFSLLIWISAIVSRSINRPIHDLTLSLLENIRSARKNQIMKIEVQTAGYREIQRVSKLVNKLVRVTNQKTKSYQQVVEEERAKALYSARMASVGQMAGNVAHEINSPLAAISLHVDLLCREIEKNYPNDQATLNRVLSVRKITDRIAKIVKGFLAISREGKSDPLRVYWLQEILQETLDLCQSRMKANNVSVEIDPVPHVTVKCRGVQISQALLNLLNNSYDAIQNLPEKWIRVEFRTRNQRIVISITDSGHGIPSEVAEKMMEPFFTTKDINKGTGLGLSISRSILEDHGGRLYYDPHSAHTRFIMELPTSENP